MLKPVQNYDDIYGETLLCDDCDGKGCGSCKGVGFKVVIKFKGGSEDDE